MVAELAARQWGVVSRAQLRRLAVPGATVDYWVATRRLLVVHRGVYAPGHRALRAEGYRLAAVLACGAGAVLSHRSAAAHWGLLATEQTVIDVTAPRSRDGVPGIRLHRSRSLDARDTTTHEAIPITTIARTLLRPPRHHRPPGKENGHGGKGALARATRQTPHLTRSELEVAFRKLVRRAGLPDPVENFILDAPDHPRLEVDFYFPAHNLVIELDGWETHRTRAAFKSDRRKDAALTSAGYRVMRFTYEDVVHEPDTVVARLTPRSAPA